MNTALFVVIPASAIRRARVLQLKVFPVALLSRELPSGYHIALLLSIRVAGRQSEFAANTSSDRTAFGPGTFPGPNAMPMWHAERFSVNVISYTPDTTSTEGLNICGHEPTTAKCLLPAADPRPFF
jgi:hypothetical protein